jgi:hypothetical protein
MQVSDVTLDGRQVTSTFQLTGSNTLQETQVTILFPKISSKVPFKD